MHKVTSCIAIYYVYIYTCSNSSAIAFKVRVQCIMYEETWLLYKGETEAERAKFIGVDIHAPIVCCETSEERARILSVLPYDVRRISTCVHGLMLIYIYIPIDNLNAGIIRKGKKEARRDSFYASKWKYDGVWNFIRINCEHEIGRIYNEFKNNYV